MRVQISVLAALMAVGCGSDPGADKNVPGPAADFSFNTMMPDMNAVDQENASANAHQAVPSTSIPKDFHGRWDTGAAACANQASETRLEVSADTLRFHESEARVLRVTGVDRKVVDVTAEYRGEGQAWENRRRLRLSAGGDRLTVAGDGSSLVRRRCS